MNDIMKTVTLLAIATIIHGEDLVEETKSKCITVNDIYQDIEVLKTDVDRPYSLAVDNETNIVYFSYTVKRDEDVFKTGYINLNTKEFKDIDGVNGFTQTVDQKNHEIYIGGNDGIYKYNHITKTAETYAEKGIEIWNIYYKDNILFYSTFPQQFFYTYVNGESIKFKELQDTKVDQFLIDNEDIMFYTNSTGLFGQKKGTDDAKLYQENSSGIRCLTTDKNGKIYFCKVDGIYEVDKASVSVIKIADLDDVYGVAFDIDNNIIYSDSGKMIRLKPNKDKSC